MAIMRRGGGGGTSWRPREVFQPEIPPTFEPTPQPPASQIGDASGASTSRGPRELATPRLPPTLMPQASSQPQAQANAPVAAPPRPKEPSPVAAQAPTPTTQQGSSQLGDLSPIVRRGLVPSTVDGPRARLFGYAGGLLGGGLGVPGLGAGGPDEPTDLSQLIAQIYLTANRR